MIYITDTFRINRLDDRCLEMEALKPVVSTKTKTESFLMRKNPESIDSG